MTLIFSDSKMLFADGTYAKKAELVHKFASHVIWNKGQNELVFCVVGPSSFTEQLKKEVAGGKIQGRSLVVQQGLGNCNIIVGIANSVRGGRGVLTVSDVENFAPNGGMIGFVPTEGKIRFDINNSVAKQNGVKISSGLLSLAKKVY